MNSLVTPDNVRKLLLVVRFAVPNTCTTMYYLRAVRLLRAVTHTHSVILDADNCIVIL